MKKPVAITKECRDGKYRVLKRVDTVRQAEDWIAALRSPRVLKDVQAGLFGIDAPEEMVNP